MKTLIVMLRANASEWVDLLKQALPDHEVLLDPSAARGAITYALAGKPPAGALAALGRIEALFSVNAGVEALLQPGAVPDDVPIVRLADGALAAGMLEWVLAQALAWHRNLFDYRASQVEIRWAPMLEKVSSERPVTVLGAGHLGAPVAQALARLGFPVRTWSRTPKELAGVDCLAGREALHPAVAGAEILINLLPLTEETDGLLDHQVLGTLARGSVLINGGRGRHVVDEALLALLDTGHLRAAVLDVFREEPLPLSHPFWRHPRVFVSPHIAAPTHAASAVATIAANIRRHEAGLPMSDIVDRVRGY